MHRAPRHGHRHIGRWKMHRTPRHGICSADRARKYESETDLQNTRRTHGDYLPAADTAALKVVQNQTNPKRASALQQKCYDRSFLPEVPHFVHAAVTDSWVLSRLIRSIFAFWAVTNLEKTALRACFSRCPCFMANKSGLGPDAWQGSNVRLQLAGRSSAEHLGLIGCGAGKLPAFNRNFLLLVTRLKTLVPWAKSTIPATLSGDTLLIGHDR